MCATTFWVIPLLPESGLNRVVLLELQYGNVHIHMPLTKNRPPPLGKLFALTDVTASRGGGRKKGQHPGNQISWIKPVNQWGCWHHHQVALTSHITISWTFTVTQTIPHLSKVSVPSKGLQCQALGSPSSWALSSVNKLPSLQEMPKCDILQNTSHSPTPTCRHSNIFQGSPFTQRELHVLQCAIWGSPGSGSDWSFQLYFLVFFQSPLL